MNLVAPRGYNWAMPTTMGKACLVAMLALVATGADAQTYHRKRQLERSERIERAPPSVVINDKRDSLVMALEAFKGRPYWSALAQCGGIYFKLNAFYTDAAVRARVTKPDPKANNEFTAKLNEAIKTATVYFDGAERFLMTDRGIERADAVLTYEAQSRAAGEKVKTVEAALAAAKPCPSLYQACQAAFPKLCSERLAPAS